MSRKTTAHGRKLKRGQAIQANPASLPQLMGLLQPFTASELLQLQTPPRVAFESLRNGRGTECDFHMLAGVANNTMVCGEKIHPDCVAAAQQAQDALMRVLERFTRLGKWGLDSDALQSIPPVLDLHEQLLELYTPLQMQDAMRETIRRMDAGETLAMPVSPIRAGTDRY